MKSIKIGLSALYNKYILKKAEFWILCMRYIYKILRRTNHPEAISVTSKI